ncbi:tRNA-modifying protein YgfZ [Thalassotalea sp. 1_MG-2023]|uniref:tRNA-modifying protein YgfZ n=1 Tax=Thalassotalea sp. 1_MG-2023 TaxID=3062680 RepID=UPI0026E14911|nr:tRNA-modifying protein YgfZ [Thalassotalea sp. 1_MG-2023]MDO6427426.1 tRNA-modifying protein YgfZ [Thalassotalea sp. 1_MG-2023]
MSSLVYQIHYIMTDHKTHMKPSLSALPDAFTLPLRSVAAISISGEEQVKYLQGQVTCDVESLTENKLLHGAHCTAKGKVLSCFRLFLHQQALILLQPISTLTQSLTELQKFGVFAKVDIEQAHVSFAAVCGTQAANHLSKSFSQLPDINSPTITEHNITLLYIDGVIPRYLLVGEKETVNNCIDSLSIPTLSQDVWSLLEISQGIPNLVDAEQEYVPQMLNMQAINGISFTKGCYLGQETVARMQYLGRNKKAMFALTGSCDELSTPLAVEKQLGENWRKAGDIISYYLADNGELYVQAVLASDTDDSTNHRLKSPQSCQLSLMALPYTLEIQ